MFPDEGPAPDISQRLDIQLTPNKMILLYHTFRFLSKSKNNKTHLYLGMFSQECFIDDENVPRGPLWQIEEVGPCEAIEKVLEPTDTTILIPFAETKWVIV